MEECKYGFFPVCSPTIKLPDGHLKKFPSPVACSILPLSLMSFSVITAFSLILFLLYMATGWFIFLNFNIDRFFLIAVSSTITASVLMSFWQTPGKFNSLFRSMFITTIWRGFGKFCKVNSVKRVCGFLSEKKAILGCFDSVNVNIRV